MRRARVLLVEDNLADQRLTTHALEQGDWALTPDIVGNGEEALAFLEKRGKYGEASLPDLILLDLNLPGMGGHEVLAVLKKDDRLKTIPVVVLSTSSSPKDISKCYQLHANTYLPKPSNVDDLFRIMGLLKGYWFQAAAFAH